MNLSLNFTGEISDVKTGLDIIAKKLHARISQSGVTVNVKKCDKGLRAVYKNGIGEIYYSEKSAFFRALAILADAIEKNKEIDKQEEKQFETCGGMLDLSRGVVNKKEALFEIFEYMALMGLNMFMLYTEDTYKMEKYPWFGYLRGGYTKDELKEIDDYADIFGIEIIPCIQTLGHLEAYLRWPAASNVKDSESVLLAGADETYELIEEMLKTTRECFRSDRIHIGMDEAFGIGTGGWLKHNPPTPTKDIMSMHLKKVCTLTQKYNYHPMIWSDMFFRLSGCTGEYELGAAIPENLKTELPEDIEMIYWDYVMEDDKVNDIIIKKHFEMQRPVGFASGIWTWQRFLTCYKKSYDTSRHQLKACKENNLSTVFTTIWRYPYVINSIYSILPSLQAWAELCYDVEADEQKIAEMFGICTGYDFVSWQSLFADDYTDEDRAKYNPPRCFCINTSIQHFFNDLLCGTLDKTLSGYDFKSRYKKYIEAIKKANAGDKKEMFDMHHTFYEIIYIKCDINYRIKEAYSKGDRAKLKELINELEHLSELYAKFHNQCRDIRQKECKPFGSNPLDVEIGGIRARTETAISRLNSYLECKIDCIEELEEEIFYYNDFDKPLIEVNSPMKFSAVYR